MSDDIDDSRDTLTGGRIVHHRPFGNAPELRCHAEAGDQSEADALVAWGSASASDAI